MDELSDAAKTFSPMGFAHKTANSTDFLGNR